MKPENLFPSSIEIEKAFLLASHPDSFIVDFSDRFGSRPSIVFFLSNYRSSEKEFSWSVHRYARFLMENGISLDTSLKS